jgi:hypothetical protein
MFFFPTDFISPKSFHRHRPCLSARQGCARRFLDFFRNLKKRLDKKGISVYTLPGVLQECRMKTEKDKVTIKIPRPLYQNLSQIIQGSGFNSVTEFIVYILRDLVSSRSMKKEPSLSANEIEMIKKRLKSLGYL